MLKISLYPKYLSFGASEETTPFFACIKKRFFASLRITDSISRLCVFT